MIVTPDKYVIAVDVMGSDGGPSMMISGVKLALKLFPDVIKGLVLVGDSDQIEHEIKRKKLLIPENQIQICHSSQTIDMSDKPMQALRYKKDSSMFRSIDLLKEKKVDGILSCGNTGCLVAAGILKLRTMAGVDRPALGTVIPSPENHFVLIDVGANPATSERSLVHNAVLGAVYYNIAVNSSKKPRVGLLTIGTEEGKGIELVKNAHEMLKKINGEINYIGLIEGFQLFTGEVDVVVCDGFVGNILLKTIESLAETIKNYVKSQMKKNLLRMIGAFLANGAFRAIKKDLTADKYGGAPLLGLNGTVVKSHGSSSAEAVAHALRLSFQLAKKNKEHYLSDRIEKVNEIIA